MRNLLAAALLGLGLASAAHAADIPPGASTSAKLTVGEWNRAGGDFEYDGDTDAWQVELKTGTNYGVAVKTYCHDKRVTLYDRNFKRLATITPPDPEQEAWLEWKPTYSGRYFVQVTQLHWPDGGCNNEGIYELAVLKNPCTGDKTTKCGLPLGTMPERTIQAYNDRDWWKLVITKPGIYSINGYGGTDDNTGYWYGLIHPVMSLRRADTSLMTDTTRQDAYQCPVGTGGELCLRVPLQPGTYYVAWRMPDMLEAASYRLLAFKDN